MPDLVPLSAAASEFGISEATLYRYLARSALTRHRRAMDRRTYVDRDEIRRLLEVKPVFESGAPPRGPSKR